MPHYTVDDELPQPIGMDPHYQESVVLIYYDAESGIGGFFRIGHEPKWNDGQGKAVCWAGVATTDGKRFARTLKEPLRPEDRTETGFGCGDRYFLDAADGIIHWTGADGAYHFDLIAEDYTPRVSPFPHASGSANVTDEYAPQHWETGATVRGSVTLDGKSYAINGLGYRDHSWGRRNWTSLCSHRWVAGTFGAELTFCAASWQAVDGSMASFGYVVRNGVFESAKSVDIVAYMEIDATTNRGGEISFELANGERIMMQAKPVVPGFIAENNEIYCVDQLCTVEYNGLQGFCDFETTTNPRQGAGPVAALANNADVQGVTVDTLHAWGH